ncbi:YHS domain-containing (seleno)protein [Sphingomonas arenae]|uniref:YHS domain-containing (seleno)protein n=1 Tax=Sphingomonas arenae TaxID=2812555 RepID=UPI00196763DD|nr:YHS domain-containing (seleno)protein [Sphingomonas arenae]
MRFLALIFALLIGSGTAHASPAPPVSTDKAGVAIGGYDPTAYFTDGRPVRGKASHSYRWNGATWRFASARARATFAAAPVRYAPQFGGYCAWAVSQNYIAPGDGTQWKIVDDKLYLNFNARAKELWEADQANAIVRGHANWPAVLTRNQNTP